MRSIAARHFPRVVFRDGQKLLWNPILKKAYINRPEERVRLRIMESLLLDAGWSPHRVTFELPVNLKRDEASKRADILCYNHDFEPVLLIECKAENVPISEKTSLQITRYNYKNQGSLPDDEQRDHRLLLFIRKGLIPETFT